MTTKNTYIIYCIRQVERVCAKIRNEITTITAKLYENKSMNKRSQINFDFRKNPPPHYQHPNSNHQLFAFRAHHRHRNKTGTQTKTHKTHIQELNCIRMEREQETNEYITWRKWHELKWSE